MIIIGSKERLNALKISSCKKIGEIDKSLLLQVHKTIAKTLNPTYKIN